MISHCRKHFQSRQVFNNQFGGIVDGCFLQERNVQFIHLILVVLQITCTDINSCTVKIQAAKTQVCKIFSSIISKATK